VSGLGTLGDVSRADDDPRPAFEQLADTLREEIKNGALEPGQKLPSVRQLIEQYGFVSATVQKSLTRLRNEGWIFTTSRGSFVRDLDSPRGASAAPVTAAEFAELQAQLAALAERLQILEERLPDRTDS